VVEGWSVGTATIACAGRGEGGICVGAPGLGAGCGLLTLGGWASEDTIDKAVALGTLHNPCTNGAEAALYERESSFAFSQFYCLALLCVALLCTQWLGFDTGGHDAAEAWVGEPRAAAAKSMFASRTNRGGRVRTWCVQA
jgi:hypothetical protein